MALCIVIFTQPEVGPLVTGARSLTLYLHNPKRIHVLRKVENKVNTNIYKNGRWRSASSSSPHRKWGLGSRGPGHLPFTYYPKRILVLRKVENKVNIRICTKMDGGALHSHLHPTGSGALRHGGQVTYPLPTIQRESTSCGR